MPWSSKKNLAIAPVKPASLPSKNEPLAAPKTAKPKPGKPPTVHPTYEETQEAIRREAESDRGPTAKQLVALLSRRLSRTPERSEPTPLQPYKARPISFTATPWDVVKIWVSTHRLRAIAAAAILGAMLCTVYLLRLASLNADIDRQWLGVEAALRQRYSLAPEYLDCIAAYSTSEQYATAMAAQALRNWRTARTENETAAAVVRMEHVLTLLSKVMKHYDQNGVAKEPDQIVSSARFVVLEERREHSRTLLSERIPAYNQAVENYNDKVLGVPGMWLAGMSGLHARAPLYAGGR